MKRHSKILIAALLFVFAMSLCACSPSNWEPPYGSLDEQGNTVSIRFDAGDGFIAGGDVAIVDVYNPHSAVTTADGKTGFYLLSPDDPRRNPTTGTQGAAYAASRPGYELAGWYTQRTPRVDENGQPLDDYGIPTATSGRPQGYSYSGKWDFDKDIVTIDPNGQYSSSEPVLTLYAAWIPHFNYEIYAVDSSTGNTSLIGSHTGSMLELPVWNQKNGKLDLNHFPKRSGFTFDGAYLDAAMTQPLTENIQGLAAYADLQTGTTSTETVKIYTTWLDGEWFKIYTAGQLFSNSQPNGNYIICADLDFTNEVWSPTLSKGRFTGQIIGNGHTISGISVIQADNSQLSGGIFGALEGRAVIRDLKLENVSYTISAGSRMQGASFGLLAGSIASGAVLENVEISGTLLISDQLYPLPSYTIGLLCGNGGFGNMDLSNIHCTTAEETSSITIEVEPDGTVTVNFSSW